VARKIQEDVVRIVVLFVVSMIIILNLIAMFDNNTKQEAPMGTFAVQRFNKGWRLVSGGKEETLTLPVKMKKGKEVVIVNRLPKELTDKMSIMMRASMEDMIVYIDGKKRQEYSSKSISGMSYYIPSAYVITELNEEDGGKSIEVHIRTKGKGVINEVTIGHGNNVWFPVIKKGLVINGIAIMVLIFGIFLTAIFFLIRETVHGSAGLRLGILMVGMALWVMSESTLRQFIYQRPSLSQYFSYLSVELIGALACMYFDEVQHKVYHKCYLLLESLVLVQLFVNVVLHLWGVMELYSTMIFSFFWVGISAVVSIINIICDVVKGRVREYKFTAVGMVCFVVLASAELLGFYMNQFHVFGGAVCMAMIVLMNMTGIQIIYDEICMHKAREKKQTIMTINTIETIAGAIDARDEYTGGHSERVGLYAERLAREMAADYDLSEEDILNVHYIGLVHDIGKIGVADPVLNKSGKLSEEEFSLMKQHVEIGYEIMSSMEEIIPGMLDGIRYHHERFDGTGYPEGLSDTDIPLVARILSIADSYDAMTSNRVYRERLTDEEVRKSLLDGAGSQFDPALTELFVRLLDRKELSANITHGMATNALGDVLVSAKLENRLQKDLLEGRHIAKPTHVRMLCYIIKLMEKRGVGYQVLLVRAQAQEQISQIRSFIKPYDLLLQYDENIHVLALFNRNHEEAQVTAIRIKDNIPDAEIEFF
ncbi:MAG: HD-GYP domain-containing protein, partial [Lachnospiraceae bacterium]|nr:HD-GYP domain-containing protein [Lachnospiraceae bacterium]